MNGLPESRAQSMPGRSDPPVKPTSEVAHQPGQQPAAAKDPYRRIVVLDWFDVFEFDRPEPTITCPDCDTTSPELRDVWAAVKWADDHQANCPA